MSDGSPFDPTDSVHVAERLSVVATERDRLAARLAEVEAERDHFEAILEQDEPLAKKVRECAEVHTSYLDAADTMFKFKAERDRLAQELEDTLDRAREAIAYLRIVLEGGHSGAAREFLARFPVKGDEG